jgi:hypothetical protein
MHFTGRLSQDGKVILERATGSLLGMPASSRSRWWGQLAVPPRRLLAGGTYRLELADGRSGCIALGNVASGADAPALATFTGCGQLG